MRLKHLPKHYHPEQPRRLEKQPLAKPQDHEREGISLLYGTKYAEEPISNIAYNSLSCIEEVTISALKGVL